jgi:hypothetical protein
LLDWVAHVCDCRSDCMQQIGIARFATIPEGPLWQGLQLDILGCSRIRAAGDWLVAYGLSHGRDRFVVQRLVLVGDPHVGLRCGTAVQLDASTSRTARYQGMGFESIESRGRVLANRSTR